MDYDDRSIGPSKPSSGQKAGKRRTSGLRASADAEGTLGDRHDSRTLGEGRVGTILEGLQLDGDGNPVTGVTDRPSDRGYGHSQQQQGHVHDSQNGQGGGPTSPQNAQVEVPPCTMQVACADCSRRPSRMNRLYA